jgi:hypothetical protein
MADEMRNGKIYIVVCSLSYHINPAFFYMFFHWIEKLAKLEKKKFNQY